MIRIELDEPTLTRTRIAISPLLEAVASLFLLVRHPGEVPWPYSAWAERVRRLPRNDAALFVQRLASRFPDFLAPIPPGPSPTIDDELAALRDTPAELIAEQLAHYHATGVPPEFEPFLRDPRGTMRRYADGLGAYWSAAIEPYWPAMRAALDEEVLHRARALASHGPDALLADLHDRIRWNRPVLTLVKPADQAFTAFDKRLLLVPLIFSRGALICSTDDLDTVAVTYQARGAVLLADEAPATERDRLSILVGRGRAAVLRELVAPTSTSTLADRLGLAPSTISEHLSALSAAGVVNRRRVGRRVLYGLEPAGLALLNLLDPADDIRATG